MKINQLHSWNVSIDEAKAIQNDLRKKIILQHLENPVRFVAGADVSYSKKFMVCFAAVTVFRFPELEIEEQVVTKGAVNFPYVPGYLTFREAPVLLDAFERLTSQIDLVIFDGQGIAHPRQMGLAAHVGLILNMPSIGCAKKKLVGRYENCARQKGTTAKLIYQNRQIGAVVRTRENVKPVFVSPGYKISIEQAVDWVLKLCTQYRLPEPVRQSHLAVNHFRVNYEKQFAN